MRKLLAVLFLVACSSSDDECPAPAKTDAPVCERYENREAVCMCVDFDSELEVECANQKAEAYATSQACGLATDEWHACIVDLPCDAMPFDDCADKRVAMQNECNV